MQAGFQADIEAFNGRWQEKVWKRFHFASLTDVRRRSRQFVTAHRKKNAERIEDAPRRRVFPKAWKLNLQKPLTGRVVYVRKTSESGCVSVLGHTWEVSKLWCHRLVRVDVDLTASEVRIHALRRRDPSSHTLLATHQYDPPTKRFHE